MRSRSPLGHLSGALGASLFLAACGSASTTPPSASSDAGTPACPAGPTGPTAPSSMLPSGECQAGDQPCYYEGTPCPSVVNGAVNGYACMCVRGAWSCEVVNQSGLCAPIPYDDDAGPADASSPAIPPDGAVGLPGPTGPTKP